MRLQEEIHKSYGISPISGKNIYLVLYSVYNNPYLECSDTV